MPDAEIVFQVRESPEGGYEARASRVTASLPKATTGMT